MLWVLFSSSVFATDFRQEIVTSEQNFASSGKKIFHRYFRMVIELVAERIAVIEWHTGKRT